MPENKVYGYARVSTKKQASEGNGLDVQEKALKASGASIVIREEYTGTVTNRPQFDKLLQDLNEGDTLMVVSLDRLARSTVQGIELVDELLGKGIRVHILNMGVLDNTPSGKLIRNIFFAFAEFERSMIVERTQSGREIARQDPNYREGRPRISKKRMDHAMELLKTNSYTKVVEQTGISKSTLIREKKRRTALQ